MRSPHWKEALTLIFVSTVFLATAAVTPASAQQFQPAPTQDRVKDAPLSAIRQSVAQPGGIKASMTGGNTVYAAQRESRPRADGYRHIDTPTLVSKLRGLGLNTYVFGIWDAPTDWDDLRLEFAPAAAKAGIKIWVYIVPPSECFDDPVPVRSGRCARPYKEDYVRWAHEIATLSRSYPNVVAWAIDDFISAAQNAELFTPAYMQQIVDSQDAVNPMLGFYTTAYYAEATDPSFYARFAPYIDGIVYPYLGYSHNTQDPTAVGPNLENILKQTEPRHLDVMFLLYAGRFLDAGLPPTETYAAQSINNAMPYLRSGRIIGIDAYGLPLADKPALTADNRAAHGIGRFAVALAAFAGTRPGYYAQAQQQVAVNPRARKLTLSFADFDWYTGNLGGAGYHFKQLLVDGKVVWESDVADAGGHSWVKHTVDLTQLLRGRSSATIALRVLDKAGVGDFPLDLGFDDVSGQGIRVTDGGFESTRAWQISGNNTQMLPSIDLYATDRPARIKQAVATALRGQPYVNGPFRQERPTSGYRTDNSAMYGNGRLSFVVPQGRTTTAGGCASASQVVRVDRNSPRYELSFWDYDQYAKTPAVWGHLYKRVLVDGYEAYHHDVADYWEYTWMNGESAQGPIDVSDFLRGKDSATITFQLCTQSPSSTLDIDVGMDTVETIGFTVANPGFESRQGWTLSSTDPAIQPSVKIAR